MRYRSAAMRWIAACLYLSALLLAAAAAARLLQWPAVAEGWLVLAWTASLAAPAAALFRHPMRAPAWGLFAGFWGSLAILTLVVLQALGLAGVRGGGALVYAASWPLAVFATWLLLTCALGLTTEGDPADMPPLIDALGLLAGAALLTSAALTWLGAAGALRPAFLAAAGAYVVWAVGVSSALWNWGRALPPAEPAAPRPAAEPLALPSAAAP